MPDQSQISLLIIIPLKLLFTLTWVFFLIAGSTPLQQIRQMNRVIATPLGKISWLLYFTYVVIAILAFGWGIFYLWVLPSDFFKIKFMSPRIRAYLTLLLVSVIWGVAGPVIKYTLTDFPPFIFLFYRFLLSGLFALITLPFIKLKLPRDSKSLLIIFLFCFLTTTVSLLLLFLGYDKTSSLVGTTISAVGPMLIAAAGVLFLREHITKREVLGIGITLVGTTMIIFDPQANNSGHVTLIGNLLVFLSLLVGVVSAILAKLILRHESTPFAMTQLSFIIGFITLVPFTLINHPPQEIASVIQSASVGSHLGVIFMAFISGTLAYTLWLKAQKTIEVSEAALFNYTYPIWAAPLSLFWLHESVSKVFIIGCFIIAIGVAFAEIKHRRN